MFSRTLSQMMMIDDDDDEMRNLG